MKKRIDDLIKELNYHTDLYNQGKPEISDNDWDKLYFELVKLEKKYDYYSPNSPTRSIHYTKVDSLPEIPLDPPMLSLDKTKDWNEFLNYFDNYDVVGMIKVDGLSCRLIYKEGRLVEAVTRGNGAIGSSVLHNALVIRNIPQRIYYQEELVIDGEIICSSKDFEAFKDTYANPRNFAAGSIRLLDSEECAGRNLKFLAWNTVKGPCTTVIDSFEYLSDLGFTVTPWTSGFDLDAKEFLIERAKNDGIPIDGLVGRFDDREYGESLGSTGHHSRAAYAFKFHDEIYETELIDIEWSMGRTGQITPIAIFKEIEMEGSLCSRASLHNISIMKELFHGLPFKGQKINVFKSNLIIPQVYSTEEPDKSLNLSFIEIPKVCGVCGGEVFIKTENNSSVLMCANPACEGKIVNRFENFCGKKGLDIKGLSKATLSKLINWDWLNTFEDIMLLKEHREEWIKKPGFGVASVDKILGAIETAKSTTLAKFLSAIGIPLVGKTVALDLTKYFKTYEEFRDAVTNGYNFAKHDKFGEVKSETILNFDYTEADNVYKYLNFEQQETVTTNESCKSLKFVITGKLSYYKNREELTNVIKSLGGSVISSISKNVDYLINNDINSVSSKNNSAKKLGIPIISEKEFLEKFI